MSASSVKQRKSDRQRNTGTPAWVYYLLVFTVPFILFSGFLGNGFVFFDDDVLVLDHYNYISNPDNLTKAFTSDVFFGKTVPYYRPMLNITLMAAARAGGPQPQAYHLFNLLLHCFSCLSLLWLLSLLGFNWSKAVAGSLIFAVHPVFANAVFWIPALNDILATLFSLLSFAIFIKFTEKPSRGFFLLQIFTFAFALFSKESAIVLPFMFILFLLLNKKPWHKTVTLFLCLSWSGIILLWFYLRAISTVSLADAEVGASAILKNLRFLPELSARVIIPFNLALLPVFSAFFTLTGVLIFIVLTGMIIMKRPGNLSLILFGLAWLIAFSLPNMSIRLFNSPDSYDYLIHRGYLPGIGLVMIFLGIIPGHWIDFQNKYSRWILGGIFILFAGLTINEGRRYDNGEAFWNSVTSDSPDRAWFQHFYGRYYFKQKDFVHFEEYLRKAIKLKEYGAFYYNLGMIRLMVNNDADAAYPYFIKALDLGAHDEETKINFSKLCVQSSLEAFNKKDYNKAMTQVETALKYDPGNPGLLMNLALFSMNEGNKIKAVSLWRKVIQIDPAQALAYKNLYIYYNNDKEHPDSAHFYSEEFLKHGGDTKDLQFLK